MSIVNRLDDILGKEYDGECYKKRFSDASAWYEIKIFSNSGINYLISDLMLVKQIREEEDLRRENVALENAYKEYELLLKIIKND